VLTIAGLRSENASSDSIFAHPPGPGFLGEVFASAKDVYVRAGWSRYWIRQALEAEDSTDLWRFGLLAEKLVDWRFARDFAAYSTNQKPQFRLFSGELHLRLSKAAEARRKKRKSTLFGLDLPSNDVLQMIAKSRIQF
jgi:hypothetical protein